MESLSTETNERWLLRVTDLKQYEYCPRVVFFQYCMPGVRPTTYKMEAGIAAQDRVEELEKRRSLRAYELVDGERHFNVSVQSMHLQCSGQVDLVVESQTDDGTRLTPIDFKLSRRQPGPHFKLQLACYALMLEEAWGVPVSTGYIYLIPRKQAIRVEIDKRLRQRAVRALGEIRMMIENERMLAPTKYRQRCIDCEFRRFCGDTL